MPIRPEIVPAQSSLTFLRRCFRFVSVEWRYAAREQLPDQGFEQRFRESCVQNLDGWIVSEQRELRLGADLDTASGVSHEIDIVARQADTTAILEAKNLGDMPVKNDVAIFYVKVIDYLLANPSLTLNDLCLAFMSRNSFEPSALAACLGLGIHPIASDVRPFPILVDNAMRMVAGLHNGLAVAAETRDRLDDLCSLLNNLGTSLNQTWPDNRFGYLSQDSILIKATNPLQTTELAVRLRKANSDCIDLLDKFRDAATHDA